MKNISFRRKALEKREKLERIRGFVAGKNTPLADYVSGLKSIGFQATNVARAVELLKKARKARTTLFLSMTSNIISCGLREVVADICRRKAVDAIITSTGAIEEDWMKSRFDFFSGDFAVDDEKIKNQRMNRIGNVLVPDEAYLWLEDENNKLLEDILKSGKTIVPSEYAGLVGKRITDKNSYLHWAAKNKIPVFCPGFVDGAIGDHIYFFNKSRRKLVVDQAADLVNFYDLMISAEKTAGLVVGGGIAKHHLIGAAILRNGLDYAVYISTGTEGDGSLSGARPREAVSWNKLKSEKNSVFIEAEATLVLPLLALGL